MGNCVSQAGQKEFLRNLHADNAEDQLFSNFHPDSFQVFVKKRNKFIPGTLKITENEIVFLRSRCETLNWPLQFLRRYGFTSAGIFFFESGRRCIGGEGLHTFQSHQAEAIFQLVQSRIQDNANIGIAIRERTGAHSVSGSIHSIHNLPSGYSGARIQPIQRYLSEGTGNIGECLPGSYSSSYHRPYNSRFNYHQHLMPQVPRRPRSIADPANHTTVWPIFSSLSSSASTGTAPVHYRRCLDQPAFLGNVVSEHIIHHHQQQQRPMMQSSFNGHSYVNVIPQRRSATSSPQCLSPTLDGVSQSSSCHFPFNSTSEAQIDRLACTFNRINNSKVCDRYRLSPNPNPSISEQLSLNRYVNAIQELANNDREPTPPQLNYASLTVGGATDDVTQQAIRKPSPVTVNGDVVPCLSPSGVNYTKIDLDKTHAVELAHNAVEKQNQLKRLNHVSDV